MLETIVTYRVAQAPKELTRKLPAEAGPRRCLFWIAPVGSQALAALFDAVPEPDIDHVTEAMWVASDVARYLHTHDVIPAAVGAGPTYSVGFHSGDADEVEAYLRGAGHHLVPIFELDLDDDGDEDEDEDDVDPSEALYFAALNGDLEGCKRAIGRGAKLGFKEFATGATALHEAASGGHGKVVSLLLEAGADVNAMVKGARTTPLGNAVAGRHLPVVKRLLEAGARTDVRYDRVHWTPVHAAVSYRAPKILAALLDAGADVNARTDGGKTALEIAVQEGDDPNRAKQTGAIIVKLREAGADPEAKSDAGESALELARSLGRSHLERYLTEPL